MVLFTALTFLAGVAAALAAARLARRRRRHLAEALAAATAPAAARPRRPATDGQAPSPAAAWLAVTGGAVLGAAAWTITGSAVLGGLASLGGLYAPLGVGRRAAERRTERIGAQLAAVCVQLAAAMEAGASAYQALADTAAAVGEPVAGELRRVLAAVQQGLPLREAVAAWPERVPLPEARLLAAGFRLHFDTGADLPRILKDIVGTLHARRESAAVLRAATAAARTQAGVLAALPPLFLLLFRLLEPAYLTPLFRTTGGQLVLLGVAAWTLLGYAVTRRLLTGGMQA